MTYESEACDTQRALPETWDERMRHERQPIAAAWKAYNLAIARNNLYEERMARAQVEEAVRAFVIAHVRGEAS